MSLKKKYMEIPRAFEWGFEVYKYVKCSRCGYETYSSVNTVECPKCKEGIMKNED